MLLPVLAAAGTTALAGTTFAGAASASAHSRPRVAPVPLVVYSAQGYDKAVTTAFQKKTGIPVLLDDDSTGPLLAKVEAERNNPKWGVLWVDGSTAFAGLDKMGLLYRGYEPKVNWTTLGSESLPADKSYVPVSMTLMAAMVYNPKVVSNPPKTWQQLLQARWKGAVGMNNPLISGPTFPFVAGMMNDLGGIVPGETYFKKLKANGLVVNPTNGDTLTALENGQIKLALIQSSAAVGATFTDHNLKVVYLPPVTLLPGVIGIDVKAPPAVRAEAERFIQYVLSPAGQKVMQVGDPTGDSLFYPIVKGIKARKALPSIARVKTQSIDPYKWGPKENAINNWFNTNIVQ